MLHVPGSLEKFYVATKASCDTPTGYMYLACDWKVEQLVVLQLAVPCLVPYVGALIGRDLYY